MIINSIQGIGFSLHEEGIPFLVWIRVPSHTYFFLKEGKEQYSEAVQLIF